ncbi:MAG TPA: hypothetical protein VER12_13740 [Polyangiaceae bacterium]|nr:hypothetical protein [Polyangiaceae bacterium]
MHRGTVIRWAICFFAMFFACSAAPRLGRAESAGEASIGALLREDTRRSLQVVIPEPVVAAEPSPVRPAQRVELSDWVDPRSHSTARTGRACEQRYVAYLTGTRALNYLELKLFNDSDDEVVIDAGSRVFERTLRMHGTTHRGFPGLPLPVAKHSGKLLLLELEKLLFYELSKFDVVISVSRADGGTCSIKLEFTRTLPAAPTTFKILSRYDVGTSFGARVASGSLAETVGRVGSTATLFLDWYSLMQHGVRFEFAADSLRSDRFAGALLFLPSYQYRIFLNPRVSYVFGIGAGAYLFTAEPDTPGAVARWTLLLRERMQLRFELPEITSLVLALCPTLTLGGLPGEPFAPPELSGGIYTGTVELIVGM